MIYTERCAVDDYEKMDYHNYSAELELSEEPKYLPESSREWHAFNRSFANQTSGMKPGETRRIIITNERYIYRVEADGYMQGYSEEKVRIRNKNLDRIYKIWRLVYGINRNRETFDSWFNAVQSGQRGYDGDIYSAGNGRTTEENDRIFSEQQESESARNSWGIVEDSGEIDYET